MVQVCRLGPKVGSHLALFCTRHVNWVNSRNDSQSWCQHQKQCPGIIIIITQHKRTCLALSQLPHTQFIYPGGTKDLGSWVHTEMFYLSADSHPLLLLMSW